jgi:dethiobiotin synthetase
MSAARARVRGVFVTGTDTGVGKTLVACALSAWAHEHGRDVGVMKPVATGARRLGRWGVLVSRDARMLSLACGSDDPWDWITPACFAEPLAPLTAAQRANRRIRLAPVREAFHELSARHTTLVVEGVGGLLVPLGPRLTVADMARSLGLPLVVVARTGLGTLNHTLMTLVCAKASGLRVAGVVCTEPRTPSRGPSDRVAARTNPALIERLGSVPILGVLPYDPACARGSLAARVKAYCRMSRSLDSEILSRLL